MVTIAYFIISAIAFACLVWGFSLYRKHGDLLFLLLITPLSLLWYDSFIIATGRYIGEGDLLLALSWPRFIAHGLLLPAWIAAAGLMARRAGLGWAKPVWVQAIFWLLAAGGVALGAMELMALELFPACMKGTLRYVPYVSDGQACVAGMEGLGHAPSGPPVVPVVSTLFFLVIGVMIWLKHKMAWLFLGSLAMFVMAGMPQSIAGPLLANSAEPLIALAVLWTARRFAGDHQG